MINLAPQENVKQFRRIYFLRLTTVVLIVATALVVIHGVLLIPSYMLLNVRVAEQKVERDTVGRLLQAAEGSQIEEKLKDMAIQLNRLETLPAQPSLTNAVALVLGVPRSGISVRSIAYEPNGSESSLKVQGVAATREALRSYAQLLESQEVVTSVDFPISNLAEDRDLTFTLSIITNETL